MEATFFEARERRAGDLSSLRVVLYPYLWEDKLMSPRATWFCILIGLVVIAIAATSCGAPQSAANNVLNVSATAAPATEPIDACRTIPNLDWPTPPHKGEGIYGVTVLTTFDDNTIRHIVQLSTKGVNAGQVTVVAGDGLNHDAAVKLMADSARRLVDEYNDPAKNMFGKLCPVYTTVEIQNNTQLVARVNRGEKVEVIDPTYSMHP